MSHRVLNLLSFRYEIARISTCHHVYGTGSYWGLSTKCVTALLLDNFIACCVGGYSMKCVVALSLGEPYWIVILNRRLANRLHG